MALAIAAVAGSAVIDRVYAAPPTSNEIRVGVTSPITGPASAYGVIAKVMAAMRTRSTPRAASTAASSI